MLRGIIVSILLGLVVHTAQASSAIIQPRYSNLFRFNCTDVWNIDVQLQAAGNINVYIVATVSNSGKAVAIVTSNKLVLVPGMQSLNSINLGTDLLNYKIQSFADIEELTGSLPSGNYTVCYSLLCVSADCDGMGNPSLNGETTQCFELIIEPPTPLLLAMPMDKAELEWPRPTFNWIPPMPLSNVNGFNYWYRLVEAQKGQSCNDAMIRNRPIYSQSGIELPLLPYPGELNDLDTGKKYCWKVDGLVGDVPVAQSEVWEFTIVKDTIEWEKITKDQSYINILDQNGDAIYYALGQLKLKYVTRFGSGILRYRITDAASKSLVENTTQLVIKPGDNRYVLDLANLYKFKNLQIYWLFITLPDGQSVQIKFKYIDQNWYNERSRNK